MEVEQFVERAHAAKQAKLTPSPEFTIPRLLERHTENFQQRATFATKTPSAPWSQGIPKAKLSGKRTKVNRLSPNVRLLIAIYSLSESLETGLPI